MNLKNLFRFLWVFIMAFGFWGTMTHSVFALAPLCNLNYSAGEGGTVDGEETLLVRTIRGGTGREVQAIANSGYIFVGWDDGLKTAKRQDVCLGGGLFFHATFRRVGAPTFFTPNGIGTGKLNRAVTMNERGFVGVVDLNGINVFVYLGSRAEFEVNGSQSAKPERHEVEILNLDMNSKKIQVQFSSEPQVFEMSLGDSLKVDLDGDKVADISVKYQDLVINRVELTLTSVDSTIISETAPCATCEEAPALSKYVFDRDLYLNMTGADVKELQKFLNNNGFLVAGEGPGSAGNETETFGSLTKQALIRFQLRNGITPAAGYFGPITRGIVNGLMK